MATSTRHTGHLLRMTDNQGVKKILEWKLLYGRRKKMMTTKNLAQHIEEGLQIEIEYLHEKWPLDFLDSGRSKTLM